MKIEQMQWSAETGWKPKLATPALGSSAQMVLLFGDADVVKTSQCLELCKNAYPKAHLFGCTTAGEIQGTEVREGTLAVTAVAFDHTRVEASRVQVPTLGDSYDAGVKLVQTLDAPGLKHIFILSEGIRIIGSELVRGINSVLPDGVTLSGGFAGDGDRLGATHVWCDGQPELSSVAALGFYGEGLKVGVAATGAWGAFGPDRLITKSKDNVLYEVDGRSVLGLYKDYLGEHAKGLPISGLMFPLCVAFRGTDHSVLRALLAVDEDTQSIVFAGDMPEGSRARMMMGNIEQLIDGSLTAAKVSRAALGESIPELTILVSCNGRRHVLKQRIEEEVEAVQEVLGAQTAMTGFYSYGEIAPIAVGERPGLHNETMIVTSFAEV